MLRRRTTTALCAVLAGLCLIAGCRYPHREFMASTNRGPERIAPHVEATATPRPIPTIPRLVPVSEDASAQRFLVLKQLRDRALITPEEYAERRAANLGALLPLTRPAPAAGLDRPSPPATAVEARLEAIAQAEATGALTPEAYAAERQAILDHLLPGPGFTAAKPARTPKTALEADAALARTNALHAAHLIDAGSRRREDRAIASAYQRSKALAHEQSRKQDAAMAQRPPRTARQPMVATGAPVSAVVVPARAYSTTAGSGKPAVHLGTFPTKAHAMRGWTHLHRTFADLLEPFSPTVIIVDRGAEKSPLWRLEVGPLSDRSAASKLCRKLDARRQFCRPLDERAGTAKQAG